MMFRHDESERMRLRLISHNGNLSRRGALRAAQAKLGEFATISSDDQLPRLVWRIGAMDTTCGIGLTWSEAVANAKP